MRYDDKQLGKPEVIYSSTKDNIINTFSGIGMVAYATDTEQFGYYTSISGWVWETISNSGGQTSSSLSVEEIDGTPSVSDVSTIKVTNGTLTNDGDGVITLNFGNAATDNDAIHNNVSGEINAITEKTTLVANDILLIEDSADNFNKKRIKTSNLSSKEFYGIRSFVKPISANFTWVNQDDTTIDTDHNSIYLYDPPKTGGSIDLAILKKTAPSTPYTITACILLNMDQANYHQAGLCWRQSSDGKLVVFAPTYLNAYYYFALNTCSSPTTAVGDYATSTFNIGHMPIWLQISDDGTNRICRFSHDGLHFTNYHSIDRTNYLTADEVGICINSRNATYGVGCHFLSWEES